MKLLAILSVILMVILFLRLALMALKPVEAPMITPGLVRTSLAAAGVGGAVVGVAHLAQVNMLSKVGLALLFFGTLLSAVAAMQAYIYSRRVR